MPYGHMVVAIVVAVGAAIGPFAPAHADGVEGGGGHRWSAWQPVDPAQYPPLPFDDCDRSLVMTTGDFFESRFRERTRRDGVYVYQEEGTFTVDVSDAITGEVLIDELDISGDYLERVRNGVVTFRLQKPALIIATTDAERTLHAAAGLPPSFYFERGRFTASLDETGNPIAILQTPRPRHVRDLCGMIAAEDTWPTDL